MMMLNSIYPKCLISYTSHLVLLYDILVSRKVSENTGISLTPPCGIASFSDVSANLRPHSFSHAGSMFRMAFSTSLCILQEVVLETIDTDELTRMAREFLDQK